MLSWFTTFLPAPSQTSPSERLRGTVGALIGIVVTGFIATLWAGGGVNGVMLMAPIGASAVLVFAVPASPMAQPWPVLVGNMLSAIVGVAMVHAVPSPMFAAGLAVGGAIALMVMTRSLHPPGGAVALTAVLGGAHAAGSGFEFVLVPVLLNSCVLVVGAIIYNNATGHSYPHRAHPSLHSHSLIGPPVLTDEDFDTVLADYGDALDISRGDLEAIYLELRGLGDERRRQMQSQKQGKK